MPALKRIAEFWALPDDPPYCVRCGWSVPVIRWNDASGWLIRAHIIDRCFDGLDLPCNLAPLCDGCHSHQPIFKPGEEPIALIWFGLRPVAHFRLSEQIEDDLHAIFEAQLLSIIYPDESP